MSELPGNKVRAEEAIRSGEDPNAVSKVAIGPEQLHPSDDPDPSFTIPAEALYEGHITHLMHSSSLLNQFRLFVFTVNPVILGAAANIYFLHGFDSSAIGEIARLKLSVVLCIAAVLTNYSLHCLSYIYLSTIQLVEEDLARMTRNHAFLHIWQRRLERRATLRDRNRIHFHAVFYGTVWLYYIGAVTLAITMLVTHRNIYK